MKKVDNINERIIGNIAGIITCIMIMILTYSLFVSGPGLSLADTESGLRQTESGGSVIEVTKPSSIIDGTKVSFSFDGPYANTIIISGIASGENITWEYSLDGKNSWIKGTGLAKQLDEAEIAFITPENDIKVKIVDIDSKYEILHNIDIKKGVLPNNLYANDLENRIIGFNSTTMEWKYDEDINWNSTTPIINGTKFVHVRIKTSGQTLKSDERIYSFTEDTIDNHDKYVPLSNLTILDASSPNPENLTDGNGLTTWNVANSIERYITLKVTPMYTSSVELIPSATSSNRVKSVDIYTSTDNINWNLSKSGELINDKINLDTPVLTKFIKVVITSTTIEGADLGLGMINLYEDASKRIIPTAEVKFDIDSLTNQNVTATLVNPNTKIEIISEGGELHTFSENGTFTFRYKTELDIEGSTTATVNWIDKTVPTADIDYNIKTPTSGYVIATLTNPSETITITNNKGSANYIFKNNGEFVFEYKDAAGNVGTSVAKVDWIRKTSQGTISHSNNNSSSSSNKNYSGNKNNSGDKTNSNDKENNNSSTTSKTTDNLKSGDITLKLNKKVPSSYSLKIDKLKLTKTIKAKSGSESEYFNIYVTDKNGKNVDLKQNMKMAIKLDSDKEFKGLYKVSKDDKLEDLDYKKTSTNQIEVEIQELGNYLISYDKKKEESTKEGFKADYIIAIVIAIVILFAGVQVYKKTRN